jgi:hypothetical protein
MSPAFAMMYSWMPFCLAGLGLVAALVLAVLWAEYGGWPPPRRAQAEDDEADDDDRPPWERPGAVRRDCEPHRGEMLVWLGRLSVWLIVATVVVGAVSVVAAVVVAIVVMAMASRDRAKMRAGTMDPAGEPLARKASRYGMAALIVCGLVLVGVGCLVYELTRDDFWSATESGIAVRVTNVDTAQTGSLALRAHAASSRTPT